MKTLGIFLLLTVIASLGLIACNASTGELPPPPTPATSPTPTSIATPGGSTQAPSLDRRFSTAQREFSLALFRQIAQTETKENLFVSPASIAVALAMTYNGARGDTQKA